MPHAPGPDHDRVQLLLDQLQREPLHSLLLAFRIGRRRLFVELGAWNNILRERDACQAQAFGRLHVDLALASDTLTEDGQVGTPRQRGRSIREDVVRPCLQALD